jgi:hypothetical protein
MKRYSIMVRETGSDHEVELCQVDRNPKDVADAVAKKMLRQRNGDRQFCVQKYDWIRIIDHAEVSTAHEQA